MKKILLLMYVLITYSAYTYGQCNPPKNLTIHEIYQHSVNFEWAASTSSPSTYNWEIRTSGLPGSGSNGLIDFGTTASTSVNSGSMALTAGPKYTIYVQADCGAGSVSNWESSVPFNVACTALNVPWFEGFEGNTVAIGPTKLLPCWRAEYGKWDTYNQSSNAAVSPRNGNNYLNYNYNTVFTSLVNTLTGVKTTNGGLGHTGQKRIWTPLFALEQGHHYRFKFWYRNDGTANWNGDVLVNNNQSSVGATELSSNYVIPTLYGSIEYIEVVREFKPQTSGEYSFGVGIIGGKLSSAYDDFSLEEVSGTCPDEIFSVEHPFPLTAPNSQLLHIKSSKGNLLCPNTGTILSIDFPVTVNSQYQWQESFDNVNWVNITDAVSNTLATNFTSDRWYRVVVFSCPVPSFSMPIQISTSNLCYCIPKTIGVVFVQNVQLGTINNTNVNEWPFYHKEKATTLLNIGQNYSLTLSLNASSPSYGANAWFDFNQNGVFEANEAYDLGTGWSTKTITVNVPSSALIGQTRCRIKSYSLPNGTNGDPCTQIGAGEVEDYPIYIVESTSPRISSKVYFDNLNDVTNEMPDELRLMPDFPLDDPYSTYPFNLPPFVHETPYLMGVVNTSPAVLSVSGNDAIVDWVYMQLLDDGSNCTQPVYSRTALLQRDGDIVDIDGVSPVVFPNAQDGNYYVSILHRNHLAIRSENKVAVSYNTTPLNFTNNSITLHSSSSWYMPNSNTIVVRSGDANMDGSVDAFDLIIWELENGAFNIYDFNSDYNLDASSDANDSPFWEYNNGSFQDLCY